MTKTSAYFYIVDMANNMDSDQTAPWEQYGQRKFIVFTSVYEDLVCSALEYTVVCFFLEPQ